MVGVSRMITRTCQKCGKPFEAVASEVKRGFGKVCSISCRKPARDPIKTVLTHWMPEPNSGCWLWLGPVDNRGYGVLTTPKGKWKAHRLSLILHTPWQNEWLEACHRCDVPSCINPDHLFWGTHQQNMADSKAKGRSRNQARLGEDHHNAKLTEADVLAIRQTVESSKALGGRYGVNPSTVRDIRRRKIWRHIP